MHVIYNREKERSSAGGNYRDWAKSYGHDLSKPFLLLQPYPEQRGNLWGFIAQPHTLEAGKPSRLWLNVQAFDLMGEEFKVEDFL